MSEHKLSRRDFIAGAGVLGLSVLFPTQAALAGSRDKDKCDGVLDYSERGKMLNMNALQDYRTGQPYKPKAYALAYFATPYVTDPNCGQDVMAMASALLFMGEPKDIKPVLIFSEAEEGDPYENFAKAYSKEGEDMFVALRGQNREDVIDLARQARLPFQIDRKSGKVNDHAKSYALIAPDGQLLKVMSRDFLNDITRSPRLLMEFVDAHKNGRSLDIDCGL